MCRDCNYLDLLGRAGLGVTEHRLRILETIGNADNPLSAGEIFTIVGSNHSINRVTVYRILDNLVDHGLVQRLSSGGRSFFYGLAPNAFHSPHPHFYCQTCGRMNCLAPETISMDMQGLRTISGKIQNIEVRIDGVCRQCLNGQQR